MKLAADISTTRLLYGFALLYQVFPFFLFSVSWLRLPYSLLVCALLIYCVVISVQRYLPSQSLIKLNTIQQRKFLLGLGILVVWVFFSGIGGFSYQTLYAPGKGPFSAAFGNTDEFIGDPAVPLSPNAIRAGIGQPTQVPEPATGLLMLAAAGALVARRRFARSAK